MILPAIPFVFSMIFSPVLATLPFLFRFALSNTGSQLNNNQGIRQRLNSSAGGATNRCVDCVPVASQPINATSKRNLLSQSDHLELIRQSMPLFVNKTLTVCVVVREPFVIYTEPPIGATGSALAPQEDLSNYSGVAIEVLKRLVKIFKFRIRIIRPRDNQFGVLTADRGWTGLMGSLARNESDVGVTALSITVNRAQAVDFTRAYYVETAAVLLRIPEEVQNYFAIFEPFSMGVWITLMATIIVLIALITIMTRLEEEQSRRQHLRKVMQSIGDDGSSHKHSVASAEMGDRFGQRLASLSRQSWRTRELYGSTWLDRFYYATSCVLNILLIRDIRNPPGQTPIRILVCFWWLSTIVIVNIYLGILFGQLVVPQRPRSIESLEELVGQEQVEWCVTSGTGLYELFRESRPDTVYGQLGRRMRNVSSADEGVRRVTQSGWAFIRERSILTFKVAQEHSRLGACKMQFAREEFFSVGFGLALGKRSALTKPFNSALTLMIENGFVSRWQSMYWPTRNQFTECKLQPLREGEPLSMKHFMSIYLVGAVFVALSLAVLMYQSAHERLFNAPPKRRPAKRQQPREATRSNNNNTTTNQVAWSDDARR